MEQTGPKIPSFGLEEQGFRNIDWVHWNYGPAALIEEAIALLLQIEKTLCEGAGAAGLAAILANPVRFAGKRVGLILSGGNIDNRLLLALLQRQQVRDGKLLHLRMILPDQTGALGELCTVIGACGGMT